MKLAKEFRREAWVALGEGQYWPFVGALVVMCLMAALAFLPVGLIVIVAIVLGGAVSSEAASDPATLIAACSSVIIPAAAALTAVFIYAIGFMMWSQTRLSLAVSRREMKFELVTSGWGHGWKMGWISLVQLTYVQLWCLLLVIPGLVKSFSYAMTPYIAVEHPDWTANECITESRRIMDGNKWRLFCLRFSFIGWYLLLIPAAYIPFAGSFATYFLMPYYLSSVAAFYEEIKGQ
jgi:hypothetical protein